MDYRGALTKWDAVAARVPGLREAAMPAVDLAALEGGIAGVQHSGDKVTLHEGRHEVRVALPRLDPSVTDLFFTLSAYNCADLTLFPDPSVVVLDAKSRRALA